MPGRIGCQPVCAMRRCASADSTYSQNAVAAAACGAVATWAIGLYSEIAPSAGQTRFTGDPFAVAERTSESSVRPTLARPWATAVTTSGTVLTWVAPLALSRL